MYSYFSHEINFISLLVLCPARSDIQHQGRIHFARIEERMCQTHVDSCRPNIQMRWCEYLVKRRATAWAENSPGRVTLTPFNRSRRPFYSVTGFNSHYTLSSYVHFAFLPSAVFTMYSQFILVWSSRMSFTKCILERWTSRSNLLNQDLDPMGVVHVVLVWILTLDPVLVGDEGDHLLQSSQPSEPQCRPCLLVWTWI